MDVATVVKCLAESGSSFAILFHWLSQLLLLVANQLLQATKSTVAPEDLRNEVETNLSSGLSLKLG